jgi:hypothetical protein
MMQVSNRFYIPYGKGTEWGDQTVDPRHITAALAVLYMDEKGGRVHITKDLLLDAQSRLDRYQINIIENEIWIQERDPSQ